MKIALLIRGIAYLENYIHHTGKVYNINYKNNLSNLNHFIQNLKQNNEINIYISTQSSKLNDEVISDFNPKDHIFLETITNQNSCLLFGLNLIKDQYDFVIVTRFDLKFKFNIMDLSINYDKFNILWKEQTKDHRINDCIHLFNYKFINPFVEALIECPYKKCIHHIMPYIKIDNKDINFIYDEYYDSNSDNQDNPIYTIERGNVLTDLSKNFWYKYLGSKLFNFM